jgi:hypothetical protein
MPSAENLTKQFTEKIAQSKDDKDSKEYTKEQADYRPAKMHPTYIEYDVNCGECGFFEDGACKLVEGDIDRDYVCKFYQPDV